MTAAAIGGSVLMFAPAFSPGGNDAQAAPRLATDPIPSALPEATAPIPKVVEVTPPKVVEVPPAPAKAALPETRTAVAAVAPPPASPPAARRTASLAPSADARLTEEPVARPVFTTMAGQLPPASTSLAEDDRTAPAAASEDFVGVWAVNAKACIPNVEREGFLPTIINTHGAWAGETTCAFKGGGQREGHSWTFAAVCSDATKRWKSDVQLTVKGRRLTWKSQTGSRSYVRCDQQTGPDQAALVRPR
jgi:hypothetical protein